MNATSPSVVRSPLAELHAELGARFVVRQGAELPADYGSVESEHRALRSGCGLVDRSASGRIEARGEDRLRFLGGQTTCELKDLEPGRGIYGFFTSVKGRIDADGVFLALEDRVLVELPPGKAREIAARLERYVIADRVEIEVIEDSAALALVGPRADATLDAAGGEAPAREAWSHRATEVGGIPVRVLRQERPGGEALGLWMRAEEAESVARALLAAGATPVGSTALDALRIERGEPVFGLDFGPENFPQETGLDDAVSFTKGCYLGQEVVARLHYRGQVSRQLRALVFDAGKVPEPGAELLFEGRAAATLGSAAYSPALERAVGLAIVQRRAFEPGTRLELTDGRGAEVRTAPLV